MIPDYHTRDIKSAYIAVIKVGIKLLKIRSLKVQILIFLLVINRNRYELSGTSLATLFDGFLSIVPFVSSTSRKGALQ